MHRHFPDGNVVNYVYHCDICDVYVILYGAEPCSRDAANPTTKETCVISSCAARQYLEA